MLPDTFVVLICTFEKSCCCPPPATPTTPLAINTKPIINPRIRPLRSFRHTTSRGILSLTTLAIFASLVQPAQLRAHTEKTDRMTASAKATRTDEWLSLFFGKARANSSVSLHRGPKQRGCPTLCV